MKLGDVCDVVRGSSPRPKSDSRFYGGSVPRLMVADLTRDGKVVSARIDTLTELGAMQSRPMMRGDVVIAVSGAPGLPAILAHDACIHDGFVGLRDLDRKRVDPEFLYAFLTYVRAASNSQAVGAIFKNLTTDQIRDINIPELPLMKQRQIAKILDHADALRAKRRAALAELDSLTQSIFLGLFGNPATNPKGWPIQKLGDHASKIGSGATPLGGDAAYKRNGISLIRSLNVRDGEFSYKDLAHIDNQQAAKLVNVVVEPNDVLLNITGASVARVCRVPAAVLPARVNQHVSIIRLSGSLVPEYIEQLLLNASTRRKLLRIAEAGATRQAITKAEIGKLEIPIPPIELQREFAKRAETVETLKKAQRASLAEMDDLFASLQHRVFRSGSSARS